MHDLETGDDLVERLVRDGVGSRHRVTAGSVWLMVLPEGVVLPEHGWKLHVSTRVAAFHDLVATILPVLVAAGCAFKLARSPQVLAELSDGISSPASVGKAVTIYPDQQRVTSLGRELADLLAGWPGPRILSDRRVTPPAPVYYRYGPFASGWEADSAGLLAMRMHGPGGESFKAAATLGYRQPSWVTDPFTREAGGRSPGAAVLGGYYEVMSGLRRAARGDIYRATDRRDGRWVIIKQARALVAEDQHGADTRLRLRNERRVLQVLDGLEGVPEFLDHFRNGEDEYLVTSDCGPANLAEEVLHHGPYPLAPGARGLSELAAALARRLADLHGRGVIMRDLSPANIVIGEAGPSLIDFGIASYDGLYLPGATHGFAPERQCHSEPPAQADDYYALGMVLLFAVIGLDPVIVDEDCDQTRVKALQTIGSRYGQRPAGLIGLIADLLSGDETTTRAAFLRLLSGRCNDRRRATEPLPKIDAFRPGLAADVTGALLGDLLQRTGEVLNSPPGEPTAHDASIYHGTSGIGLELLQHLNVPGTAQVLADLAAFSAPAAQRVRLPQGLFAGTTGVSIFLQQAQARGITVPAAPWGLPGPDWQPESRDLISGAAGVGLGHLWLHEATSDPACLAVAIRCGEFIMTDAPAQTQPGTGPEAVTGIDPAAGRAHGLAGVTEFLLTLAERTGDQPTLTAATQLASQLAARTRRLLPAVRNGATMPIAVSWCRGLAGIGQVLLYASRILQKPALASLAREAADACIIYTPRLNAPARCCCAAGVGHFLIDLAITSQDERYWQAAQNIGRQILLRSGGPPGHPLFTRNSTDHSGISWAFGIAGILPFFRRLAHQGGTDSLPSPSP